MTIVPAGVGATVNPNRRPTRVPASQVARSLWSMCGRFVSSSPPDELARYFDVDATAEQVLDQEPNYNTAPTNDVFVVYEDGSSRRLDSFRWGLIPRWAKDPSIGNRMINARAETVATKGAFKSALAKRRCIIPVDGFYEWRKVPGQKTKQPFFIHRPDGEPFAFAGLWEEWTGSPGGKKGTGNGADADEAGEAGDANDAGDEPAPITIRSATIITGTPNEKMAEIHDRMPIILPPSAWDAWLSPDENDLDTLGKFLVPAPASLIEFHPISTEVNNVRNKGEHLTHEVDPTTGEVIGET